LDSQNYELTAEEIVFSISPPDSSSFEADDGAAIIGQARALAALALGLGIHSKGYNIFIMGSPGTGRRTALQKALSEYSGSSNLLQDKTYVSNFSSPLEPRALSLPAGKARDFKRDIHDLVEATKRLIALHEESDSFKSRKNALFTDLERMENHALSEFETEAASAGFQIIQVSEADNSSTDLIPLKDGKPSSFDELQALVSSGAMSSDDWNSLRERYYALIDKMKTLFEALKSSRTNIDHKVAELRREMVQPLVTAQIETLKASYGYPKVTAWLDELRDDICGHLFLFSKERLDQEQRARRKRSPALSRYGVNILVDRSESEKPPIVFENRPTLANLVGNIDYASDPSEVGRSGYLHIRGGSLFKASGGVLVLRSEDILNDEDAWQYLKRVLQTGVVEIQGTAGPFPQPATLKPEPIDISLKVVMIGGELSYDLLFQTDPDFQKLFKVCAEFDSTMDRTPDSENRYAAFLRKLAAEEGLRPLTGDGLATILEQSVRDAEHRGKLSTRFSLVADLLREANYWASLDRKSALDSAAIRRAVEMRSYLRKLPEDKLESLILSDEIIVALDGKAVGKANGLAVHDRGYYAYGLPVVVSARVAPGDGGVINIEGESGLSGEIFDKAVLILSGYLRSRYARGFPLSITASVCFEQMYTAVDGDSATAVQLLAILSAISGLPIRQDLAVTGSVNQLGDMQPVGGISEKVEGFHSICSKRGLSGTQGVLIPRRNINNLILSDKVEEDVRAGRFHIYAVDNIDQAIEVLCGRQAGTRGDSGSFPEGSVNELVSRELKRMADVIRKYET
jgi:predicted ATP-dependent protease